MREANQENKGVFGDIPVSFDTLFTMFVREFVQRTGTVDLRTPRSKTDWYRNLTASVRGGLKAIGEQCGAELCRYELLVDHSVLLKNRAGYLIACESEWRSGDLDIRHDFEKLRSIKSPLKLFAYRSYRRLDAVRICSEALAFFEQQRTRRKIPRRGN